MRLISLFTLVFLCMVMVVIPTISADFYSPEENSARIEAKIEQVTQEPSPKVIETGQSAQTTPYIYSHNYAVIPTTETPSNQVIRESSVIILIPTSTFEPTSKGNRTVQKGLNVTTSVKYIITPLYKPTPFLALNNSGLIVKWTPNKKQLPTPYPGWRNLTNKL